MDILQIERNELLEVLSEALNQVEKEVLGVTAHHAKRVAWLCIQMGRKMGMPEQELSDLATAALLHDSALNEYRKEYENGKLRPDGSGKKHCIAGEKNLSLIPGYGMRRGYVLYHHECADGSGPFGKCEKDTPLGAQLIHIANDIDSKFALGTNTDGEEKHATEIQACEINTDEAGIDTIEDKLENIRTYVRQESGRLYGETVSDVFLQIFFKEQLEALQDEKIQHVKLDIPPVQVSLCGAKSNMHALADLFARIIDYKSPFTKNHSVGLAEKAECMAFRLGWGEQTAAQLYLAGALHDIGKLFVDNAVLEKPGRLEKEEYQHIQTHAEWTWRLLSKIHGFETLRCWASCHHEKLNGKGYPFGKTAQDLGKEERLLACLDIYQALTEDRPYKTGMAHAKAVGILKEMAEKGELDAACVEQIAQEFGNPETSVSEKTALFSCGVCGYLHEADALEPGFSCPVCKAGETSFLRVL
uniref:HD domain-containing phosphohydrolase n=1 Tax=Agathobacter sp. TaxID=2021311 RepID=UPI004056390F